MKITNEYFETMVKVDISAFRKKDLTVPTSYHLSVLFEKLQEKAEHYLEHKKILIEKYAKKGVDGRQEMTPDGLGILLEDPESYRKDLKELMDITVPVEVGKIDVSGETAPFTMDEMDLLRPFIVPVKADTKG